MWVVHGCVPLRGPNLVPTSLQGLPARTFKPSATAHQVERVDGDPKAASSDFHEVMIMLTSMFSFLAWAEPLTIVPVGPQIDTTNEFSFRNAQAGLMIDLIPWAINTLRDLPSSVTINSQAATLGARSESSALSAPVSVSFPDSLSSTASSISQMLAHMVPTKSGWTCIFLKSTSDSEATAIVVSGVSPRTSTGRDLFERALASLFEN